MSDYARGILYAAKVARAASEQCMAKARNTRNSSSAIVHRNRANALDALAAVLEREAKKAAP